MALSRADDMTQRRYEELESRLDDLATELAESQEYRQARSAPARKKAAEAFLTTRADGFAPPGLIREELYARARERAKAARSTALF